MESRGDGSCVGCKPPRTIDEISCRRIRLRAQPPGTRARTERARRRRHVGLRSFGRHTARPRNSTRTTGAVAAQVQHALDTSTVHPASHGGRVQAAVAERLGATPRPPPRPSGCRLGWMRCSRPSARRPGATPCGHSSRATPQEDRSRALAPGPRRCAGHPDLLPSEVEFRLGFMPRTPVYRLDGFSRR